MGPCHPPGSRHVSDEASLGEGACVLLPRQVCPLGCCEDPSWNPRVSDRSPRASHAQAQFNLPRNGLAELRKAVVPPRLDKHRFPILPVPGLHPLLPVSVTLTPPGTSQKWSGPESVFRRLLIPLSITSSLHPCCGSCQSSLPC